MLSIASVVNKDDGLSWITIASIVDKNDGLP